jgi:hypothetical protein
MKPGPAPQISASMPRLPTIISRGGHSGAGRGSPWFPTLAAAPYATLTIRLGTMVTNPNHRHPVTLAKDLITLDELSDGRIMLGIGSGGTGFDATVLGDQPWTARERADRFGEFVRNLPMKVRLADSYPPVVCRSVGRNPRKPGQSERRSPYLCPGAPGTEAVRCDPGGLGWSGCSFQVQAGSRGPVVTLGV